VIDVKEIFSAVLDDEPPPPPTGEQVIRRARNVMRRAWLVRAGLAAAAVVAAVLAVPRVGLGPTPVEPAEPAMTPTEMSDTLGLIERFGTVVTAALPNDVVAQPGGAITSRDPHTGALTMVELPVNVERSGEHGQIIAFWLAQPGPAPSGGLCTAPWPDCCSAAEPRRTAPPSTSGRRPSGSASVPSRRLRDLRMSATRSTTSTVP
jgi:hypothetical protein